MFTNTFHPHVGGVARSVATFAEDLQGRGHRVLVVAPVYGEGETGRENGASVARVPALQNFNGSDFSVRIPLPGPIHQRIEDFAPDLIHSHHPFLLGDAALRAARHRDLPLVFTHHTLYERYTHYVPFDSPALRRFAIHLASRYANLCQLVIAPSESLARLLGRREVRTPCRVVPTGVDTAFFAAGDGATFRRRAGIEEDALVIGHLGRLAPEKNLHYLARAVAGCLRREARARFLVAGRGPSAAAIEEIFEKAGLSERLVVVGELRGEDLRNCYAAMDLFAFASTSETQGMVLTEAMAAGKPVVALDAPGVREVVRDGRNGRLLAADAGEEAFAEALYRACADPEQRTAWQEAARATAREFSRDRCVERLADVYREAAAAHARCGHGDNGLGGWDALLRGIQAEWELVAEKAGAVLEAVRGDEAGRTRLE